MNLTEQPNSNSRRLCVGKFSANVEVASTTHEVTMHNAMYTSWGLSFIDISHWTKISIFSLEWFQFKIENKPIE